MASADEINAIVVRAEQAAYERGRAAASDIALSERSASAVLRAQADAMVSLSKAYQGSVPAAAGALSAASSSLRETADELGG